MRPSTFFFGRMALPIAAVVGIGSIGCTNDAQVGDDSGGTSTGSTTTGQGGGTSSTTTSTSGSGGDTGTGGNDGGGGGGVGGAVGGCPGAEITVEGDGPTKHFAFACLGSYGITYSTEANGHVGYEKPPSVDPNGKEQLWVDGCATANQQPQAGSLSIEAPQPTVGTTMTGKAMYYDGIDAYATDTDVTLTVTSIDDTLITGTYTASLMTVNNGVKNISGSFGVCHVADFFPP